jgi:hypothetical protein
VSIEDDSSEVAPGWYPDPADDARLRRWDGTGWTQEVLLAPDQAPAAFVPQPPVAAPPRAPEQPSPLLAPEQPSPESAPPVSPPPTIAGPPPVGQPVPASPPPTVAPPAQPGSPNPSPAVSHQSHSTSGPVSLPEWANLPGLTLPPDLSSIPGMETDSVLGSPTFANVEQHELPKLPVFEPPFIPERPDLQNADAGRARDAAPLRQDAPPPPPATPYAPPPAGAQYDVPPPPGMAHVPSSATVLPPSAFVAPQQNPTSWPVLPPVGSAPAASPAPQDDSFGTLRPSAPAIVATEPIQSGVTISVWLISALPLIQFAVIYLVFRVLAVTVAPGMQWGILAAPAAFSLLFANADRKILTARGLASPNIVFALIPPGYLIARCITTGRSSVLPLVAWIVLQAAAGAGVYFLLSPVLAAAIRAIG